MDLESTSKIYAKSSRVSSTHTSHLTEYSEDLVMVNNKARHSLKAFMLSNVQSCVKTTETTKIRNSIEGNITSSTVTPTMQTYTDNKHDHTPNQKQDFRANIVTGEVTTKTSFSSQCLQSRSYDSQCFGFPEPKESRKLTVFTENNNISFKSKYLYENRNNERNCNSIGHENCPTRSDDIKFAEKTTYCRPLLNPAAKDLVQKALEKNNKLHCLVRKIVEAREREKHQEAWNNYINELKTKHATCKSKVVRTPNHYTTDNELVHTPNLYAAAQYVNDMKTNHNLYNNVVLSTPNPYTIEKYQNRVINKRGYYGDDEVVRTQNPYSTKNYMKPEMIYNCYETRFKPHYSSSQYRAPSESNYYQHSTSGRSNELHTTPRVKSYRSIKSYGYDGHCSYPISSQGRIRPESRKENNWSKSRSTPETPTDLGSRPTRCRLVNRTLGSKSICRDNVRTNKIIIRRPISYKRRKDQSTGTMLRDAFVQTSLTILNSDIIQGIEEFCKIKAELCEEQNDNYTNNSKSNRATLDDGNDALTDETKKDYVKKSENEETKKEEYDRISKLKGSKSLGNIEYKLDLLIKTIYSLLKDMQIVDEEKVQPTLPFTVTCDMSTCIAKNDFVFIDKNIETDFPICYEQIAEPSKCKHTAKSFLASDDNYSITSKPIEIIRTGTSNKDENTETIHKSAESRTVGVDTNPSKPAINGFDDNVSKITVKTIKSGTDDIDANVSKTTVKSGKPGIYDNFEGRSNTSQKPIVIDNKSDTLNAPKTTKSAKVVGDDQIFDNIVEYYEDSSNKEIRKARTGNDTNKKSDNKNDYTVCECILFADSSSNTYSIPVLKLQKLIERSISNTNNDFDEIINKELNKSNQVKKDINEILGIELNRPCGVQIAFESPTKDKGTDVTASLSKTRFIDNKKLDVDTETDEEIITPKREHPMTTAVNTDPLSFLGLLRISTQLLRELLSFMRFDYSSYLPMIQPLGQMQRGGISQVNQYVCNICGAEFTESTDFSKHIEAHGLGSARDCCVCRHILDLRQRYAGVFRCQYCGQCFTRAYCCELHQHSCARRFGRTHQVNEELTYLR